MNSTVKFFKQQEGHIIKNSPSEVGNWLGGKLLEIEEGRMKAEIKVRHEMTNPAKMLHGGAMALICDEMIGAAVAMLEKPSHFVSVNLNTEFLRPAKQNDTITAVSEIIRNGNTVINAECKIFNDKNKLIAKAQSNLVKVNEHK
ncbi:MAG: PaaI family thioesterase [Bacteroidota bacterium]|nr:PaaI family thioesterase [Bacteroidota bacterium]